MERHMSLPASPATVAFSPAQAQLLDIAAREVERCSSAMGTAVALDWRHELTLRSRLLEMWPSGPASASGTCRLLGASDQWIALNVARPWDHEALPALVEGPVGEDHWVALGQWVATRTASDAVGRARLFDLAAAALGTVPGSTPVPMRWSQPWPPGVLRSLADLTVVDLSSLWAGPLVARILRDAGSTVVKVEGWSRPDGARAVPDFYRELHSADQPHVVVDLTSTTGLARLRALVEAADVVIEASRPRALEQLGAAPEQIESRPGRVWLSITGYGRSGEGAHWIAFGDDAAVAGGLVGRTATGDPEFLSDAVADPVTGMLGAAAVLRSLAAGGGHLIDLALAGAAAAVARAGEVVDPGWP
jgi:hypothetical protein